VCVCVGGGWEDRRGLGGGRERRKKGEDLVEDRVEHGHIVRLALVGVGEEEVRLVGDQLGDGDLLDTENEIRLAQITHHLGSSLNGEQWIEEARESERERERKRESHEQFQLVEETYVQS